MSKKGSAPNAKRINKKAAQLRSEISSELEPFINGLYRVGTRSQSFRMFKQAYAYFTEKYEQKQLIIAQIFRGDTPLDTPKLKDKVYMLFVYLGFIESVANSVVDILVMLLVANGRDFHIECRGYRTPRIKHVSSIENDLEKERVPLSTKLSYLRENGIKAFTATVDSELRNAIAHLKFDVKNGEIYVKGKPASVIYRVSLSRLIWALGTVEKILKRLAEERGLILKS